MCSVEVGFSFDRQGACMAMEVSCGQCHGRLLVETLGVVVACPHCGTHLSIPAPVPEPAPQPAPPPAVVQPPPQLTAPVPTPAPAAPEPTVAIAPTGFPEFTAPAPTPSAPPASGPPVTFDDLSSVFGGPEEATIPAQIGWHSAPNLYLSAESPSIPAADTAIGQPALFTSPLMDRDDSPSTPATEPTVMFSAAPEIPAPASEPPPAQLDWTPASGTDVTLQVTPIADMDFQTTSMPTFSLGTSTNAVATSVPALTLQFSAPPQAPPVFAAAPPSAAVAPTAPLMFGAAAPAPAPVAPTSAPAAPLSFGAAPSAVPMFTAAPAQAGVASAPVPTVLAPTLPSTTVAQEAAAFAEHEVQSQQKFLLLLLIVVGSYASAVTIVLAYMLIFGRTSTLESLPDLKPPMKNGEISWNYNPPKNDVAPGHILSLGQSRRFGNVRVTPIKVTRGVVNFEHYKGDPGNARSASEPILKLWVKFENVSHNQTIAPLDSLLLYTRKSINLSELVQANCFVAAESDRRKGKPLYYHFDMPIHSEYRMIGQDLSRELKPGDTLETFVPSEEDAPKLKGDLVWRFQFRKGYSKANYGVTTLIDVKFSSGDIKEERGAT